jgi:hypothetical protein
MATVNPIDIQMMKMTMTMMMRKMKDMMKMKPWKRMTTFLFLEGKSFSRLV